MFAALKAALLALPVIIELVQKVLMNLNNLIDTQRDEILRRKFKEGIDEAVATKDTSKIENTLRGKQ